MNIKNKLIVMPLIVTMLLSVPSCFSSQGPQVGKGSKSSSSDSHGGGKGKGRASTSKSSSDSHDDSQQEQEKITLAQLKKLEKKNDELRDQLNKVQEEHTQLVREKNEKLKKATDEHNEAIEKLQEEAKKQTDDLAETVRLLTANQRVYNIQSTYGPGSRGDHTDVAEAKYFDAQANSLQYNNWYQGVKDVAGGVNKIIAPAMAQDLAKIITAARQNLLMLEIEKDEEKIRQENLKNAQASTSLAQAQELNVEGTTLTEHCRISPDSECTHMRKMFSDIQKRRWEEKYEKTLGKKYEKN